VCRDLPYLGEVAILWDNVCRVRKPPAVRKPPPLLYLATQSGQLCALKGSLERTMTHQDEFSQPYWWQSVSVTVVSAVSELELVPLLNSRDEQGRTCNPHDRSQNWWQRVRYGTVDRSDLGLNQRLWSSFSSIQVQHVKRAVCSNLVGQFGAERIPAWL